MQRLDEVSLSRVKSHFDNPEVAVSIFTMFRSEQDLKTNKRLNSYATAALRSAGFGFFYVEGGWIEHQGTPEEVKVEETSIFVQCEIADKEKLFNLVKQLAFNHNASAAPQDAVVFKDVKPNGKPDIYLCTPKGRTDAFKGASMGKFGEFYTRLRKGSWYQGGTRKTFVFEGVRFSRSWSARILEHYKNR